MNKTPQVGARGRFTVNSPYTVNPAVIYTVQASRRFADCERRGDNVSKMYYEPVGLIDGQGGFSLEQERLDDARIITLAGQDGSTLYVPTSYIATFPDVTEVQYQHIVISCSLGALPDTFDPNSALQIIRDQVSAVTGVTNPAVTIHSIPVTQNPTSTEHQIMENTRLGNITVNQTVAQQNQALQAENTRLSAHINELMAIIQSLGGLN